MRVSAPAELTPGQARDELRAVLDDTQQLIGGTWTNQDDPSPRGCAVQWGIEGQAYASLRITTDAASDGLVDWISRTWQREGIAVVRTEIGPASQLVGRSDAGMLILRVSDRGVSLQGESACRPE